MLFKLLPQFCLHLTMRQLYTLLLLFLSQKLGQAARQRTAGDVKCESDNGLLVKLVTALIQANDIEDAQTYYSQLDNPRSLIQKIVEDVYNENVENFGKIVTFLDAVTVVCVFLYVCAPNLVPIYRSNKH